MCKGSVHVYMQLVTGYADSKSGAHHPVAQGSFPIVVKSAHN